MLVVVRPVPPIRPLPVSTGVVKFAVELPAVMFTLLLTSTTFKYQFISGAGAPVLTLVTSAVAEMRIVSLPAAPMKVWVVESSDRVRVQLSKSGKLPLSIFYTWHTIRCNVGLDHVRMHDLRHSYASFLVNQARLLYEVQRLPGHADARTTQRYAHLSPGALLDAVNVVGNVVGRSSAARTRPAGCRQQQLQ